MKALVKSRAEPGIWMEDVAKPTIGPNDLLIRVHYASICGTDLHIVNWDAWAQRTIKVPLVLGLVDALQKENSWWTYRI